MTPTMRHGVTSFVWVLLTTLMLTSQGQWLVSGASRQADLGCRQEVNCRRPNCVCPSSKPPLHMAPREIPQLVYFTFDDAVTDFTSRAFNTLFPPERKNPNGCPIPMTLFISHTSTNYNLVRSFYDRGMELAVHSVNHRHIRSADDMLYEAVQQRKNIAAEAGVPINDIKGWRSPFLLPYGNKQMEILKDNGFLYDSTLTIDRLGIEGNTYWPLTLDYGWPYPCMVVPCPKANFTSFWEIPIVSVMDYQNTFPCQYIDGCVQPPPDADSAFQYLWQNFESYYKNNRAPFGINMHAAWFAWPERLSGMDRFIQELGKLDDVYIVTVQQLIDYIKNPVNLNQINSYEPFACRKNHPIKSAAGSMSGPQPRPPTKRTIPTTRRTTTRRSTTRRPTTTRRTIPKRTTTRQPSSRPTTRRRTMTWPTTRRPTTRRQTLKWPTTRRPTTRWPTRWPTTLRSTTKRTTTRRTTTTKRSTTRWTTTPSPTTRRTIITTRRLVPTTTRRTTRRTTRKRIVPTTTPTTRRRTTRYNMRRNSPTTTTRRTTRRITRRTPPPTPPKFMTTTKKTSNDWRYRTATPWWDIVLNPVTEMPWWKETLVPPAPTTHPWWETERRTPYYRPTPQPTRGYYTAVQRWPTEVPTTTRRFRLKLSEIIPKPSVASSWSYWTPLPDNRPIWQPTTKRRKITTVPPYEHRPNADPGSTSDNGGESLAMDSTNKCLQGVNCFVPHCFCEGKQNPQRISLKQRPQMVYITFEGPINSQIYMEFVRLFSTRRRNPNGCQIKATFFVPSSSTDPGYTKTLYERGNEISLLAHIGDPVRQRDLLSVRTEIPKRDIKGWRAENLTPLPQSFYNILPKYGFQYDSTMITTRSKDSDQQWPLTLDFGWKKQCNIKPCPTDPHPGVWEVPVVASYDNQGLYPCTYMDGCHMQPQTTNDTYRLLWENFQTFYNSNRAPFAINLRQTWFHYFYLFKLDALNQFIEKLVSMEDVYIVTISEMLDWIKDPVPLNELTSFQNWQCF